MKNAEKKGRERERERENKPRKFLNLKLISNLKPDKRASIILVRRWSPAPITVPMATPIIPNCGDKNKAPPIMPRLYRIGERP